MTAIIIYCLIVTVLAVIAAHLIEKLCIACRFPTRGLWIAVGVIALASPLAAFLREPVSVDTASRDSTSDDTSKSLSPGEAGSPANIVFWSKAEAPTPVDGVLVWIWPAMSLALFSGLLVYASSVRRSLHRTSSESIGGVRLLISVDAGPAVVGVFRYQLIIPRWALALPDDQRRLIIAHEMEHARKFDPLLLWFMVIAIVLTPWNFALWYVVRRLRRSVEIDCDQRVLSTIPSPDSYMRLLVDVAERESRPLTFASALAESPSQLRQRLITMTISGRNPGRIRLALLVGTAALVLTGATLLPPPASPLSNSISALPVVRSAATVTINGENGKPTEFNVFATDSAEIVIGTKHYTSRDPAAKLKTPASFEVDLTGGEVKIASVSREMLSLSASFSGSPATKATMQSSHITLVRGGMGLRAPFAALDRSVKRAAMSGDSILANAIEVARKLEPSAFDTRSNSSSSVIGLLFDENGQVAHHSIVTVPDSTALLRPLFPKLFPNPTEADDAPYGVMALVDGELGSRNVQLIAVWLSDPRKMR